MQQVILVGNEAVRWLGGVDLLEVRRIASGGGHLGELRTRLAEKLGNWNAIRIVAWCVERGVISAAPRVPHHDRSEASETELAGSC